MSVRINFIDGFHVEIDDKTLVQAWTSESGNNSQEFYTSQVFDGSRYDGTGIATSNPVVGLQGLLGSSDWFTINGDTSIIYKTTAILSLEG